MLYEYHSESIYCEVCKKWYNIYREVYQLEGWGAPGPLLCLEGDHIVGYTWELPEIFLPGYKPQKYTAE